MLLMGVITMSFLNSPLGYSKFTGEDEYGYEGCATQDTIPEQKSIKMQDLNNLQAQLDRTLAEVDGELRSLDFAKLQKDAAQLALQEIDIDKMLKNVELVLKDIDLDKIIAQAGASLKNIKLDHKNAEVEKALAEASREIEKVKIELKEVDKAAIKNELTSAKKEIEKSKIEIDKIDINKIMDEALAGIDKAKEELKLTKEGFIEMERDGLIDPKAGFTIEFKKKLLYINGKKQDEKTTDKYRKYFKEDRFKINIEKE